MNNAQYYLWGRDGQGWPINYGPFSDKAAAMTWRSQALAARPAGSDWRIGYPFPAIDPDAAMAAMAS